jgi:hypothetical protein
MLYLVNQLSRLATYFPVDDMESAGLCCYFQSEPQLKEAQPHQFKYDAFLVRDVGIDHCCAEPKMRSHSTNIHFTPPAELWLWQPPGYFFIKHCKTD